jgi:rhodanese-related sulfurtransferase
LIDAGRSPLILDIRTPAHRDADGWIPGATLTDRQSMHERPDDASQAATEVIVYCDCPNEASAALLALELRRRGFKKVRPLAGGFEAWVASGFPVHRGLVESSD